MKFAPGDPGDHVMKKSTEIISRKY